MAAQIPGLHHITAIASDPQRNVDFYTTVLGLRLVKKTVNFDSPETYHLYYGDEMGHPGTILTFFPFGSVPRGHRGPGQATAIAFSVPQNALGYWSDRLTAHGLTIGRPTIRFDEEVLAFADPDGLPLELIAHQGDARSGWADGPIPAAQAIHGFHSVTLWVRDAAPTARVLTEAMGLREVAREDRLVRYASGDGAPGTLVDVVAMPDAARGREAGGTIHHIAFRTPDDTQQEEWRQRLAQHGLHVTPVRDRQYFRSIYFREPGGVLFEIATDPPGFAIDESPQSLGTRLMLPPWLESYRAQLDTILPPLHAHVTVEGR